MAPPLDCPVVVFTGDACATCDRVTTWLAARGVPCVIRNVMVDLDAYDTLLGYGVRRVPHTVVGARHVQGFDPEALAAALEALRADSTPAGRAAP